MSKSYDIYFDESKVSDFFKPIRSKNDFIILLMKVVSYANIYPYIVVKKPVGKIVINTSKMNRFIFASEKKIFSVVCPFGVDSSGDSVSFTSSILGDVNNVVTSNVLSIINDDFIMETACIGSLADAVMDINFVNPGFWSFLKGLFLIESGYIRYDYDEKNENGALHPLNHLDIFYSSSATFKVGLENRISEDKLLNMLDLNTDCDFIKK